MYMMGCVHVCGFRIFPYAFFIWLLGYFKFSLYIEKLSSINLSAINLKVKQSLCNLVIAWIWSSIP